MPRKRTKKTEAAPDEIIEYLINGLRRCRLARGLSQNQSAALAGIAQSMIWRLEKREQVPTIDTLLRLSDAVGADFPALLQEAISAVRPGKEAEANIAAWGAAPKTSIDALPAKRPSVRMADIAAHLGVSRLTVSAVLNNRHQTARISEKTARQVRAAATRLGYVRNHLAIATKTGRSFSVGAIVSHFSAEWVSCTLAGFLEVTEKRGYLVHIEEVAGGEAERAALTRFIEQRVSGIFCCNLSPDGDFPEMLMEASRRYAFPVVSSTSHASLGIQIDSDDESGSAMAAHHLWSLGHREIAVLALPLNRRRASAFCQTLSDLGGKVPPEWLYTHTANDPQTETDMEALLKRRSPRHHRPTAIFCASDELASIVMRVARRCGLSVPRDLSVVGFSGERLGALLDPRLTTVRQPFKRMGQRSAEILFQQMRLLKKEASTITPPPSELLPVELVIRESTAPAPSLGK